MKPGDLVKIPHVAENLSEHKSNDRTSVGLIVRVDRSPVAHRMRYWVKLCGWKIGPAPFTERQLEVISKNT